MAEAAYVTSVVHAPVFLPISSTIVAASGIDECWKPRDVPRTRMRRGRSGLAGAVAGRAAIIRRTSFSQASIGVLLRPPQASVSEKSSALS